MHDGPNSLPGRLCRPGRTLVLAVAALLATLALVACSVAAPSSASQGTIPSANARPALPRGFPVMPEATAAPLPSDATIIAVWTSDHIGSAAYEFYASALPAVGYRLIGLYPAERGALIRFNGPGGVVWQILAEQAGGGTRVTLQTDRP
ncbi:MAG: hypothetical protein M3P14_02230 [Chloroflexota bacterium]|nr:hypothetical protein [Chloroflexota bacterium]